MGSPVDDVVESFIAEVTGVDVGLDRLVSTPCGLDAAQMVEAIDHPWFKEPGRQPLALHLMSDFMAPEGSIYYDAIYGAFDGQHAIRNWLIPTMATIDFIGFVPTAPPALFDDGLGGTTLDEWQMVAQFGDDAIPLSRGVSVRRHRGGWLTWACDVYDTGPFRVPPPPELAVDVEAEPLPDWPRTTWPRDPNVADLWARSVDIDAVIDGFHPTDSVYHDPVAGELHGRDAIATWLRDRQRGLDHVVFEPLGPRLDDGTTSLQEWQQMAAQPDGTRVFMARGTSVRRRIDDAVVYAADYYDTASLADPDVQAAASSAGADAPA